MSPHAAIAARLARYLCDVVQIRDASGAPVVPVVARIGEAWIVYLPRGFRVVRGSMPTSLDGVKVRVVKTGKVTA